MTVSTDILRKFSPFHLLKDEQLAQIAPLVQIDSYPKGSFVIRRGKELNQIHYLVAGQVDLVDASFNSESVIAGSDEIDRAHYALCEESPSRISAMAKCKVKVLAVDFETFEMAQFWAEELQFKGAGKSTLSTIDGVYNGSQNWMVYVLDLPLFSQVPPLQLQQLFSRFEAKEFAAGEQVIREGASGDFFYVVEKGRVQIKNRFDGVIAELTEGQYFGEEALVGETIRNASAVMLEDGVLMCLDKADFKALLQDPLLRYINKAQLQQQPNLMDGYRLLDVRLPIEHRKIHVQESANVPLFSLRKRMSEFDQETAYVITDDAGKRSEVAAHLLCQAGFTTYILEDSEKCYSKATVC